MQTLHDALRNAAQNGFYKHTRCPREGYIHFTEVGSLYFIADVYDRNGRVIEKSRNVIIDSDSERRVYELIPDSRLPKSLRALLKGHALSHPKLQQPTSRPDEPPITKEWEDQFVADMRGISLRESRAYDRKIVQRQDKCK